MGIKRETGIARNSKVVYSECVQSLVSFNLRRRDPSRSDFGQTIGDEQDEDYEETVCWTFDFKVTEERVGAEEIECFVEYIGFIGACWESRGS